MRLALAVVADVHRRVQQDKSGHRGRSGDPLYGIRRVLRAAPKRTWARLVAWPTTA